MSKSSNTSRTQPAPLGATSWLTGWAFARGESVVAIAGMFITGMVAATVVGAGAWTYYTHRTTLTEAQQDTLAQATGSATPGLALAMAQDDLSTTQALLEQFARAQGLASASVTLPDGTVIADTRGKRDLDAKLPEKWTGNDHTGVTTNYGDDMFTARAPVAVAGRGNAILEVSKAFTYEPFKHVRTQIGIGVTGAVVLSMGLVMYRKMRMRMRALGAIQETLRFASEFEDGQLPASGLRLAEDLGPEALAWNRLLDDREQQKQQTSLEDAAARLTAGVTAAGGGDYAAAFDALWLGMIVLDDEGKVRVVNGAAAVFLKRNKGEMTGKEIGSLMRFEDVAQLSKNVATGKARQRASMEVCDQVSAEAEKTVLRFTVRPMRKEDGSAAMIVIEDVTQQRVADESRNAFVASATHELRTPLTTMRLYLEQLVDEGDKDPLVKARCMNVLNSESRRLERIVSDMLSVSEIEAGTFKLRSDDVNAPEMWSHLQEDFKAQAAEKDITLTFEAPPKWPLLRGDRDKIEMALHNLVGNAIKYTPEGGNVMVRANEENGVMQFEVSDNGIGIKPDELELVFEKFYRSKDKRIASITGSGIGLSLARQVVRLHGGDITVKSQIDKGSTFTLSLPAAAATTKLAA